MTHDIKLNWKAHNVNTVDVETWVKSLGVDCCGVSSGADFSIHFITEPSQAIKDAIEAKWKELDNESHPMCQSYRPRDERAAEEAAAAAAARASASAKLKTLGLTDADIAALIK